MMANVDIKVPWEESTTTFWLSIPSNTYYEKKQYIIYTRNNFIADFGGYLGLLLGSSLLALYDQGKGLIIKLYRMKNSKKGKRGKRMTSRQTLKTRQMNK